jgi:hypothetical protein
MSIGPAFFENVANQRAASPLIQVEPLDANMLQVLHDETILGTRQEY